MDYILQGILQAFKLLFSGDPQTYSAVAATVKASGFSMAASLVIGVPAGFALGYLRFPGRRQVRLVVDTLLSLPTVFIGLVVYAFISRRGPLGELGLL
ncbi:MAG: ABC transporter permease, partial [Desulfobacteraceae bacterium]